MNNLTPAQAELLAKKLTANQKQYAVQHAAEIQKELLKHQQMQSKELSEKKIQERYTQILKQFDDIGKDVRPSYAGSRGAPERLKKGILQARQLVRECMIETERVMRATDN